MTSIRYRNWHISYDPPPIPTRNCDWHYWHDDFDGAEDSGDNRYGHAESEEAAMASIDRWYEEEFLCPRCREAWPDSCLAVTCPDRVPLATEERLEQAAVGIENLRSALMRIEWAASDEWGNHVCLACEMRQGQGHALGCQVRLALASPEVSAA